VKTEAEFPGGETQGARQPFRPDFRGEMHRTQEIKEIVIHFERGHDAHKTGEGEKHESSSRKEARSGKEDFQSRWPGAGLGVRRKGDS